MRNKRVDAYMEQRFGKPDFSKSFVDKYGYLATPLGDDKLKIWRIEIPTFYFLDPKKEGQNNG